MLAAFSNTIVLAREVYASPSFLFTDRSMVMNLVSERFRSTTFRISHSFAAGELVSVQNLRPE